ncbi:Methyltransferase domain-containing protein [Lachnospiraceae bacterium XPB1003]|nr:Methyltransferase domain-containing protein [Lachnospiraceae bacterium XPB1003]
MNCYIFGAGKRGQLLKNRLEQMRFEILGYIDSSTEKIGKIITGIPCNSVEEVCRNKKSELIFISPEDDDGLEEMLNQHFAVVINKTLTDMFIKMSPAIYGYDNFYPIGHYYSLYPDLDDVMETIDKTVCGSDETEVLAVNLNANVQLNMLYEMQKAYDLLPEWVHIDSNSESKYRYRIGNLSLSNGDAVGLFSMLSILSPGKIIEVGSGWTSAIMLDLNEFFWGGSKKISFVEPYPDILKKIVKPEDNIELMEKPLQKVPLSFYQSLDEGDVLFIDSTHVSKYGSDVNYLFFEILPRLKKGVIIHLHDIFYPFDYPHRWIKSGMVWNEDYLLRAFLQYNSEFEILYFQNYLEKFHRDVFLDNWPLEDKNIHGGSFWMKKCK